jgi:EF-P beta-lysylation protein EpmB
MIPRTNTIVQTKDWQTSLATAIKSVAELLEYVGITQHPSALLDEQFNQFPLRVPHGYADKIRKGDINDPLLRQVLPTKNELECPPGYTLDPLGEKQASPAPGIIHKYHGRVLLVITGACAIHCRYCFRRHFPYAEHRMGSDEREQTLNYLRSNESISEVIFSGGDPLAVNDKLLSQWITAISHIPHIKRLRFHTRLPAVIPERITDQLLASISQCRQQVVFVLHINHANEIDSQIASAISKLKEHDVTVLNQTVLLKDINDHSQTLADLSTKLFSAGALPYYLHVLDKVAGGAHFDLAQNDAQYIYGQLVNLLPGYLVPKLVVEQAGHTAKTILLPIL